MDGVADDLLHGRLVRRALSLQLLLLRPLLSRQLLSDLLLHGDLLLLLLLLRGRNNTGQGASSDE